MPAMAELLLKRATAASVEVYDVLSGSRIVVGSCYPMRRRHHSGSGQCPTATTKAARRPAAMPSSREAAMQAFAKSCHRE